MYEVLTAVLLKMKDF